MSDLNPYPGNLRHFKVDEATETRLRIISDQSRLIQQLVDEVAAWMQPNLNERFRGEQWHQSKRILDAAAAAGFTPTEP